MPSENAALPTPTADTRAQSCLAKTESTSTLESSQILETESAAGQVQLPPAVGEAVRGCEESVRQFRGGHTSKPEAIAKVYAYLEAAGRDQPSLQVGQAFARFVTILDEHERVIASGGRRGAPVLPQTEAMPGGMTSATPSRNDTVADPR
jgi:hypothetical protein